MSHGEDLTRRALLQRGAAGVLAASVTGGAAAGARAATAPAARATATIPLPTAAQVRADYQRMVDFGPRLTGSPAHDAYVDLLRREFVHAGLDLIPCDDYRYERWTAGHVALDVLDGAAPGAVRVATPYTRSQETGPAGVTGPLVYGGVLPAPSVSPADLGSLPAALAEYPAQLQTWAQALASRLGPADGSILVVDVPLPVPLTAAAFLPIATYLHWPGHTAADWAAIDYQRTWILPGLQFPLAPFAAMGAAGVVFILDRSIEALRDQYLPFFHGYEPLPALFVDRDTGSALRARAAGRPRARLTLEATRTMTTVRSVTAVLPGASDETVILDTHTDGQGFVEENGGMAFLQLARHFASLRGAERVRRTLVFAAWPGHMAGGSLPELEGWIGAHPDLVKRAAAALTIEHLGCTEWLDSPGRGYHGTGQNELFGVWTTQGAMFDITKAALQQADLARTALLRPPVQFGVGAAFQSAGVPQIGAIAGPEYLLSMAPGGDLDKLDPELAARQTAWIADIVKRLDGVTRAALRAGDPTLGSSAPTTDVSHPADCTPVTEAVLFAEGVTVRFYGRRRAARHGVVLRIAAAGRTLDGVTVELRRGSTVLARSAALRVGPAAREVVLRRRGNRRFAGGTYSLVVRRKGRVLGRRRVGLGQT